MKKFIKSKINLIFGLSKLFNKIESIDKILKITLENQEKNSRILHTISNSLLFQNAINECSWLNYKTFTPGGWAMDNLALHTLLKILNNMKPSKILEFGLGQSSILIHQYALFYKNTKALTIEHDKDWIDFFLCSNPEDIKFNIKHLDIKTVGYKLHNTIIYNNLESLVKDSFDLYIVDGPYGSEHYSRSHIIQFVENSLPSKFCIFMDDSERNGEKETIKEILKILERNKILFHLTSFIGEKNNHTIICSDNIKFLTTT